MDEYDAVIIGGGHNGLVAALYLLRAGWSVAVLERAGTVGGASASGEITLPGFVHDLYATNQNLFVGSRAYADFGPDLTRHGLRFRVCDRPFANAFPGGRSLRVHRGLEPTLDGLAAHDAGDAEGFADLYRFYQRFAPHLFGLYSCGLPSAGAVREAARLLTRHRVKGTGELVRTLLMSTRELGESRFVTPEARAMAACWGMHLDFAPDIAGGAVFPILEIFSDMENGMAVVEGGARRLPDALAALIAERGGTVRTDAEVDRVVCRNGRAVGVGTTDGTRVAARRAVISNTGPGVLYERLLAPDLVPASVRREAGGYRYGPGTLMLHLALDGPVPWAAGEELASFGYVHIAPYIDDLARTYTEAKAGLLPAEPLLVVGQTSVVDPGRAPEGRHTLWVQVRAVPAEIRGDAAGVIQGTRWPDVADPMAERVIAKLERYAPGITELVAAYAVHTPRDLEDANPNLVGGDNGAGSHHLTQNFMSRPFPGHGRYRTAVPGLYLTGAATWPGAGMNATSGRLTARQVLRDARSVLPRRARRRSSADPTR